jgi:hypothetical protein
VARSPYAIASLLSEGSAKARCLTVQPRFLQRVNGIEDQPFQSLDLGLALRYGRLVTGP